MAVQMAMTLPREVDVGDLRELAGEAVTDAHAVGDDIAAEGVALAALLEHLDDEAAKPPWKCWQTGGCFGLLL